jgi:ABC-type multidrug transport system ATPase subunit
MNDEAAPTSSEEEPKSEESPPAKAEDKADDKKPRKKKRRKPAEEMAVKLKRVVKRFGAKLAVDDLTLEIPIGDVYGLIGPNGAGKTTTFSMMAGYLKPTEGYVEVLGYSPDHVGELKSRLGVLPQDALLPANDFVGEFLIHMARLQGIPSDKAMTVAREGLEEVQGREWWNLKCGSLSHGMAKRVALAQAFLGEPEVVLLDEPTEGLDPRIAHEVRELIKARKGRCTIVISSHNLHELEEICDAAAVLDRGKSVASGSIDELTAASEEVHIIVAPAKGKSRRELVLPMEQLRGAPGVTRVEFDDEKSDLALYFDRSISDAEGVIGAALWVLLNAQIRVSGVEKGRGLEQRVMELTEED